MKTKKKQQSAQHRFLASSLQATCPFCGQTEEIGFDEGGGEHQTYVEDCSVCCRPRIVHVDASPESGPVPLVWLERTA
jgi:hypothetical protein